MLYVRDNRRIVSNAGYRDWGAVLLFIFLLPFLVAFFWGRMTGEEIQEEVWKRTDWEEAELLICCGTPAGLEIFSMEDYLIYRLPATVPMDYEMEALKAQAVILRTGLLRSYREREERGSVFYDGDEQGKDTVEERTGAESEETGVDVEETGVEVGESRAEAGATGAEAGEIRAESEETGVDVEETGAEAGATGAESEETGIKLEEIGAAAGSENTEAVSGSESRILELEQQIEERYGIPCLYVEERLGTMDETAYERSREAVTATAGIYLCYEDQPAMAPFFAISAGSTRDSSEVAEMKDYPYLCPVACDRDFTAPSYMEVVTVSEKKFRRWMDSICPDMEPREGQEERTVLSQLQIEKDSSGYITRLKIGTESISGESFRDFFGLASACVEIEERGDQIRMKTRGMGHGFGLSQYGANEAARQGSDFIHILEYFFADLSIKK